MCFIIVKVQYFLTHFLKNEIPISYGDNSLTMKHNIIFKIFDSPPIHHEILIFKIIYPPYNMI
jgi:hypothetical protein